MEQHLSSLDHETMFARMLIRVEELVDSKLESIRDDLSSDLSEIASDAMREHREGNGSGYEELTDELNAVFARALNRPCGALNELKQNLRTITDNNGEADRE